MDPDKTPPAGASDAPSRTRSEPDTAFTAEGAPPPGKVPGAAPRITERRPIPRADEGAEPRPPVTTTTTPKPTPSPKLAPTRKPPAGSR